jgi:hypothetical protein
MNEIDDNIIQIIDFGDNFDFLESWKFEEISFSVKLSEGEDTCWLKDEIKEEFEKYWPSFRDRLSFMASFLENVLAGCRCAFDLWKTGLM